MTKSQTKSNDTSAKQVLRNIIGSTKRTVVTGDAPKTKKFDPVADQDDRLMKMVDLSLIIKDKRNEYDDLRKSFENDLKVALEDSEENPKVRHSEDEKIHVYLSVRKKYKYSEKLITKRQKLDNQMADLKAEEAKEVRNNKATLISQSYTVSFKG